MKVTITLILTIVCLLVILFCTVKRCADEDKKIKEFEEELKKKDSNIRYLYEYADEISGIKKAGTEKEKELQNAKTDKEIADIISTVIAANNSRVQNN